MFEKKVDEIRSRLMERRNDGGPGSGNFGHGGRPGERGGSSSGGGSGGGSSSGGGGGKESSSGTSSKGGAKLSDKEQQVVNELSKMITSSKSDKAKAFGFNLIADWQMKGLINDAQAKAILEKVNGEDTDSNAEQGQSGKTSGYSSADEVLKAFSKGTAVDCKDLRNLSKEDRNKALDEAPPGSRITGVVSKSGPYAGTDTIIEKQGGYGFSHATAAGTSQKDYSTNWYFNGAKNTTPRRTIREIMEGTNKYYELKK